MGLTVYNTLTGKKEPFEPLKKDNVRMYVCGPTVYSDCHLGHARAYFTFDVVFRYLRSKNYQVTYARNITDIDDKIIDRARKEGCDFKVVVEKNTKSFHEDMAALGIQPPTIEPRATEHIDAILELVQKLISLNRAYVKGGSVYYRVRSFPDYGKLSKKNLEELEMGARVEVGDEKEDPLDFALWKASKEGEPSWPSPWGAGRPGWHIECSAMCMRHLGESFDIHGGGVDLVFPHHENEIAQSEGATGKQFVKYWLHNGHVMINREKMAKSLGNFLTIKDLLKTVHPEVMRCFALSTHYRSPIDFSKEGLEAVRVSLVRTYGKLSEMEQLAGKPPKSVGAKDAIADQLLSDFTKAMDDDFNTAGAIGFVHSAIRALHQQTASSDSRQKPSAGFHALRAALDQIASVLGVFGSCPNDFIARNEELNRQGASISEAEILALIEERNAARKNRDFKRADDVRKGLLDRNIVLEDGPSGTTWKVRE